MPYFFENGVNGFLPFIIGLVVFEGILKGVSLWRSARNNQKAWFIAFLVVNTAGILPVLYLLFFSKKK